MPIRYLLPEPGSPSEFFAEGGGQRSYIFVYVEEGEPGNEDNWILCNCYALCPLGNTTVKFDTSQVAPTRVG